MNYVGETTGAATHLPIEATDEALAAAVVEEVERTILQRAIVRQTRRVVIDGPLPTQIELEPVQSIVSLTRWTPDNSAEVVDASTYYFSTRDPAGTTIASSTGSAWPAPFRLHGSFSLNYLAGWVVSANENNVPASVQLMIERAIEYRAGGSGLEAIRIGPLEMDQAPSYRTDRLPRELTDIARAYQFRPAIYAARP